MKRITNYLIAMALMAFTFTSCEDVPNPFGQILPPNGEEEAVEFEPAGSGTLAEPYNVQAIVNIVSALEAGVALEKEYYVKGYVTSIPNNGISASYNNATFYISDDKEGNNRFYIYRAKGLGGGDITDESFIKLGDEVVVCCSSWVNYQGNTPETSQGKAYIYSINGSSEGGNTPTPTPTETKAVSVADFLAAAESTDTWYQLTGTIKNLKDGDQYGNFDIEDATGSVYIYGLLAEKGGEKKKFQELVAAKGIANGKKITIIGNRGAYNGSPQVTNAYFVSIEDGGGSDTPSSDLGTKDAPITVAKALEAINAMADGGETETEAFVKGKISKVQSFNDKYKSITYYISDDGTESKELQIYSGKNINGADFAAATDLTAGDEVVVKGKLKKYMKNDEAIPEMNQPNEIITIIKAGGGGSNTGATSLDVDFKTNGQGDWTIANVKALPEGVSYIWSYDSKYGMKASAYVSGTRYESDNWLVSPQLSLANGGTMTFKQALNYATSEYVKVMYTTTNGSGDVQSSEWKEASVDTWPAGNNWTFIESKATLPAGTVRVAMRYTSTSSTAATWEIETVSIK